MTLEVQDGALLEALRALRWPARRRAGAGVQGSQHSRRRGLSEEFAEYRPYRPGEDTRRIDWKLFGRTDRAFVRQSTDRTLLSTMILVDASASLAYPIDTLEKWNFARHIALGLAAAAHCGGDPVGLALAGSRTMLLPPRTRRDVVSTMARALREVRPAGIAELAPVFARQRDRARIAIVSDFLGDTASLLDLTGAFAAAGKEVYAIHVIHQHEANPPKTFSVLTDPEQPEMRRPMTDATRHRYLENFGAWCQHLARDWRRRGAYYTRVVTYEPPAHAVRRVVQSDAERASA